MIEYANRKYLETNGFSLTGILGKSYSDQETGLQLTESGKMFVDLLNSDMDWKGELKYINHEGRVNWEFITTFTINFTGDTTHRTIIKEDITDKKHSEESLIKSEIQLRSIWENTSDAMRLTNENGIVLKVNEAYCKLFKKTRQELEGVPFYIIYKYHDEKLLDNIYKYYANRTGTDLIEFESILWDSAKVWVELENSFIEIENEPLLLLSIFRDITVRKDAELQLIAAKEKAEELNRLKTSFLENISHEFRTPMIGILGFSQLLSVNLEDEDYRAMANTIYLNGKRLLRTMDMVIDLSRIESTQLELELRELNICDAAVNEIKIFENEAQNKGLYLKLVMKKENIVACLDERLFLQVFDNLLSDAIKFTYKGGIIVELSEEYSENNLLSVLKVSDTGIGIEKEFLDLIFSDFRQASEGFKRRFEGVGLGLSISKKFAELMNCTLTVESVFGHGSVFTLKFLQHEKLKIKSGKENERFQTDAFTQLEKKNILLVDDDENTYEIIKLTLKNICNVDLAETGEKALIMVKKKKYDIILMDIILGYGMNGIETTKEIRKIKGYAKTPIVALTAYALAEDKVNFIAEGLTHFLAKPFELNQFRQFITNLFDSKK
jgi:PAS domain S-box-containing protein